MFSQAVAGFAVLDRDLRFVRVNEAFAERFGLAAAALPGRRFSDVAPEPAMLRRLEDAARTRRPSTFRTRACRTAGPNGQGLCDCDWSLAPILDDSGELEFLLLSNLDVTELRRAEEKLKTSETVYRSVFTAMNEGVIVLGADGAIVAANPAAERILGLSASEMLGRTSPEWQTVREDGTTFPGDEHPSMTTLRTGEPQTDVVMGVRRPNGQRVWLSINSRPVTDADEAAPHAVVTTFRDITEPKAAEQRQIRMIHELNHRVKNALAKVQSIATHTVKASPTSEAFIRAFNARLVALANTHDVLSRNDWTGALVRELAMEQLRPHIGRGSDRVRLSGSDVCLNPKTAIALSTVLGELATNAVQHGALSGPHGTVSLTWERVTDDAGPRLRLVWREQGGPDVRPPARRGLGARLIERGLAYELGGSARITFDPGGITCKIEIPLAGEAP
jgi:PAS domain S-box-containing protein